MPYRLTQFGAVSLSFLEAEFDLDPAPAHLNLTELPDGGVFDGWRGEEAPQRYPHEIDLDNELSELSPAALRVAYEALAGCVGRRERLWRQSADGWSHWCWAYLELRAKKGPRNNLWLPLRASFTLLSPWRGQGYGGAWSLDDGYLFENGLWLDSEGAQPITSTSTVITLPNAGNRRVTDVGIALNAGQVAAPLSWVRLTGTRTHWEWRGALAAGQLLIIDCAVKRVLQAGADAYIGFGLLANHRSTYWLEIPAYGAETLTLELPGFGWANDAPPSIQFVYADGWK